MQISLRYHVYRTPGKLPKFCRQFCSVQEAVVAGQITQEIKIAVY